MDTIQPAIRHKSLKIGIATVLPYVINYCLRNVLSVLTPYMLSDGYAKEYLAALSAAYMLAYAIGQLINGFLGDVVSPRKMVAAGLALAGLTQILFPFCAQGPVHTVLYFAMGFGLSMMRGPLMRVITGSTPLRHSRIICVFFSASSFIGPLMNSLLSMLFHWDRVFVVTGTVGLVMAAASYLVLSLLEKKGATTVASGKKMSFREMLGLFKLDHFFYYLIMACVCETMVTVVSFWIPALFTEYVHFPEEQANLLFSGITTGRMLMPFVTLTLFTLTGESESLLVRLFCGLCVFFLSLMLVLPVGWLTVITLLLALMSFSVVSSSLWSIYIPSLGRTGHVSAANGLLDASGYFAASAFSLISARILTCQGWKAMISSWMVLPVFLAVLNVICFGAEKRRAKRRPTNTQGRVAK